MIDHTRFLIGAAVVAGLLAGCSTTPRDVSTLKDTVASAESGDFGNCLREVSDAAVNLRDAKTVLAKAEESRVSDAEYERGVAAAERADQHRRNAEEYCDRRVVRVEEKVTTVDERVADLEYTREVLRGVTFVVDSAELTPQAHTVLDVVANKLQRNPQRVRIAGHTSSTGSPEHNMELSQRRAESVRNYLINRGVDGNLLTAQGYGMSDPVASNETQEGRNQNKRVELHYIQ
jgi:outer membrane protein OmpA-like peptidoglycan-associated protein